MARHTSSSALLRLTIIWLRSPIDINAASEPSSIGTAILAALPFSEPHSRLWGASKKADDTQFSMHWRNQRITLRSTTEVVIYFADTMTIRPQSEFYGGGGGGGGGGGVKALQPGKNADQLVAEHESGKTCRLEHEWQRSKSRGCRSTAPSQMPTPRHYPIINNYTPSTIRT